MVVLFVPMSFYLLFVWFVCFVCFGVCIVYMGQVPEIKLM